MLLTFSPQNEMLRHMDKMALSQADRTDIAFVKSFFSCNAPPTEWNNFLVKAGFAVELLQIHTLAAQIERLFPKLEFVQS